MNQQVFQKWRNTVKCSTDVSGFTLSSSNNKHAVTANHYNNTQ